MKKLINEFLRKFGYTVNKYHGEGFRAENYIGSMELLIDDLKIRGLKCDWIVDVGANKAEWAEMARSVFPASKFCLIEPQLELDMHLTAFCNKTPGSVRYIAGAGATAAVKTLNIGDDMASATFLGDVSNVLEGNGKQRDIDIITIDSLIDAGAIAAPAIMKIDVQGYELEVLKGSTKTFGITEAYILEVSLFEFPDMPNVPLFSQVVDFMAQKGYVVYDFPGFLRRPIDGALGQCDVCFVKKNGMLRTSNRWN